MIPWLQDPDVMLYHGDVLDVLRELPAESVDCVVTSPPYWGLRDYGIPGQLGLEPTPELYVERIVEVFREVRRVLAAHGTVWLNLGDSYSGGGGYAPDAPINQARANGEGWGKFNPASQAAMSSRKGTGKVVGLKPKDLVGIPWRVAFALQADGWYLRSDIIWSKPNPMPESVTDRPTKAHEYVFLLSKNSRYFFDQEAVREEAEYGRREWTSVDGNLAGVGINGIRGHATVRDFRKPPQDETLDGSEGEAPRGSDGRRKTTVQGAEGSIQHRDGERWPNSGRNIRSVWEIATQPYPEAHFATFPEELARRCIAAGCPEQVCGVCGKAREREYDREFVKTRGNAGPNLREDPMGYDNGSNRVHAFGAYGRYDVTPLELTDCGHADYRPGVVLDPFMGSGTVAFVARKLERHAVGIDLSESYLELAAKRLQQQSLFAVTP